MNITTIQEDGANIIKPTVKTTTYGLNSIKYKSTADYKLQKNHLVNISQQKRSAGKNILNL